MFCPIYRYYGEGLQTHKKEMYFIKIIIVIDSENYFYFLILYYNQQMLNITAVCVSCAAAQTAVM
jgi:hypothetical protein